MSMFKVSFYDYPGYVDCWSFTINDNKLILYGDKFPTNRTPRGIYTAEGHVVADVRAFDTLYKKNEDSLIFSNDGSIYVEPKKSVRIFAQFEEVTEDFYPRDIEVIIFVNNKRTKVVFLNSANNWSYELTDLKPDDIVTIGIDVINYSDFYNISIIGTTIYVRKKEGNEPYDSIDDLYDIVVDLDDRVFNLESSEEV